jgi:aspartate aminotransferase
MAIAPHIKELMNSKDASVIRKMFEEGALLKKEFGEDKVYDFSIGNPDLEPPEGVVQEIASVAHNQQKGCHGYMPNAGYMETRIAMGKKVSQEQGVPVGGEQVVMACGAAGALNCLFKAILSPGDQVLVPAPFFAEYRHYVGNYQGELVTVPCHKDFSLDLQAIENALSPKTAAILINAPNNPSGKIYSSQEIAGLAQVLRNHGEKTGRYPYLICDEPYRDIVYDNKQVTPVFPLYDNAVVVSSFAKNLSLPGERIGYIAVNPSCNSGNELVAACIFTTRILGFVNAPAFFQRVVAQSWNATVDYSSYETRRNQLMAVLDEAGITYFRPEGAFYLFCQVPSRNGGEADDKEFCDFLKKYRVLCAPGSGFGLKGWFRMAYCTSEATICNCKDSLRQAVLDWKK